MTSSKSSGRGYRRRMKKKQDVASKPSKKPSKTPSKTPSKKPSKISMAIEPERKSDYCRAFVPTERDLESDEAVWDMYNRWCLHHEIHRTPEEMQMRFIYFKKCAIEVFQANEKSSGSQLLSQYCDKTDEEWECANFGFYCSPKPPRRKGSRKILGEEAG